MYVHRSLGSDLRSPRREGRGRRIEEEEEEEEDPGLERGFLLKSEQQLIIEPSSL